MTISKKERKAAFKKLEGWFSDKHTLEFAAPDKSIYKLYQYNVLKLKYVDPSGYYALYKCMQLLPIDEANAANSVATLAPGTSINSYTVGIQGAVASYDQINNGQIKLELVDMDDKTTWTCYGDGKKFLGTAIEFGLNTALQNDKALGGGLVGGFALKKLKNTPVGFEDFDFDKVYKAQYDSVYPNNNNNNNNDIIELTSIATEVSPGIFVMNKDVNILSTQSLFIKPGQIVTTFNNFTNNGTFNNQGTFCTTKFFTNNDGAKFDNTRGYTLNYLGGTLNFTDPKKVDNRENGKIINFQSIYDDKGGIIGNQVITIE
jgi:hypothetical protein